jgi:hypothetical protein
MLRRSTPRSLTLTVDVERSDRLYGVRVEDGARVLLFDDADSFRDRLDRADFVVDLHNADERRTVADRILQLLKIDEALAVDSQIGDVEPLLFEAFGGVKDSVVLDSGGYDVVGAALSAGVGGTTERQVVAFAAARGEGELLWLAADVAGDGLA